jgi:hypothetical protein
MVQKMFGFPSSTVPYILESDDPYVIAEVENLCKFYLKGNNIPVTSILLGTNDETVTC